MRKLAIFAAAFSAGVFLAQYLLPVEWLLPAAGICWGLGWLCFLLPWEIRRRGVVVCAALALGLGWNWLYVRQVQRPMEALAGTERPVTLTLCDYAETTDYGARVTVKVDGFSYGKALFYGDLSLLDLKPGQTAAVFARFESAAKVRDAEITSYTSRNIFLLAYGRGEAVYGPGAAGSPRWWPAHTGRAMTAKIGELYSGESAGFMTAILTGDKSALSEGASVALSEAGLSHMMAISGMHCGFLLTLVTFLAGRHRRRLTAVLALPLLVCYAVLTGGSPSVLRACVMLTFLIAAPLFRRESDPPTAMAAALFLILLANPFAAASVSLQLSFAAVAGLLWLTPKLWRALTGERRRGRLFQAAAASFSATMGALVFTVPLSGWYFGTLVLVSPLSNLLCLWAAGGAFMLGLLSVAGGFLWMPLGALLAWIPEILTRYILGAARLLAGIPCHALYYVNPYLKYWLCYVYLLFALACFLRSETRRRYALAAVLSAATLALTVKLGQWRYRADLDAVVLDVGQGQCVLLASHGSFALVDCGSGSGWISAGELAADYLLTLGCGKLDYLMITHYDFDHVSGVTALLARLDVDTLLVPDCQDSAGLRESLLSAAAECGVSLVFVEEVCSLPLGGAALSVCPPVGEGGDNEQGLAVLASAGEEDLLITGDMDMATERKLLAVWELPDIEVLVAGHHGSKYSTSEELLETLRPETACISVGSNRYGHPAKKTLERLARQGCTVWRTDLHGDIHLSLNGEK